MAHDDLIKLEDMVNKANAEFKLWMRHIILLASTFLSVFISLRSGESTSCFEHYLFVITIGLIALGILSGIVALWHDIQLLRRGAAQYAQSIKERNETGDTSSGAMYVPGSKARVVWLYICYASFCASLVGVVIYAAVSDF